MVDLSRLSSRELAVVKNFQHKTKTLPDSVEATSLATLENYDLGADDIAVKENALRWAEDLLELSRHNTSLMRKESVTGGNMSTIEQLRLQVLSHIGWIYRGSFFPDQDRAQGYPEVAFSISVTEDDVTDGLFYYIAAYGIVRGDDSSGVGSYSTFMTLKEVIDFLLEQLETAGKQAYVQARSLDYLKSCERKLSEGVKPALISRVIGPRRSTPKSLKQLSSKDLRAVRDTVIQSYQSEFSRLIFNKDNIRHRVSDIHSASDIFTLPDLSQYLLIPEAKKSLKQAKEYAREAEKASQLADAPVIDLDFDHTSPVPPEEVQLPEIPEEKDLATPDNATDSDGELNPAKSPLEVLKDRRHSTPVHNDQVTTPQPVVQDLDDVDTGEDTQVISDHTDETHDESRPSVPVATPPTVTNTPQPVTVHPTPVPAAPIPESPQKVISQPVVSDDDYEKRIEAEVERRMAEREELKRKEDTRKKIEAFFQVSAQHAIYQAKEDFRIRNKSEKIIDGFIKQAKANLVLDKQDFTNATLKRQWHEDVAYANTRIDFKDFVDVGATLADINSHAVGNLKGDTFFKINARDYLSDHVTFSQDSEALPVEDPLIVESDDILSDISIPVVSTKDRLKEAMPLLFDISPLVKPTK